MYSVQYWWDEGYHCIIQFLLLLQRQCWALDLLWLYILFRCIICIRWRRFLFFIHVKIHTHCLQSQFKYYVRFKVLIKECLLIFGNYLCWKWGCESFSVFAFSRHFLFLRLRLQGYPMPTKEEESVSLSYSSVYSLIYLTNITNHGSISGRHWWLPTSLLGVW